MKRRNVILPIIVILLICSVVFGMHICARHVFSSYLILRHGRAGDIQLYADGLVAKDVDYGGYAHFDRIYLQGNPFRLFFSKPKRIWIDHADIDVKKLFQDKIEWPVQKGVTLDIDHLALSHEMSNQKTIWQGRLKKDNDDRAVFSVQSKRDTKAKGQGELIFQNGLVQSVNLELEGSRLLLASFDARRVIGWINLSWDGRWMITGEGNAGSVKAGSFGFLDPSLKISGLLDKPDFSFSGLEKRSGLVWVLDGTTGKNFVLQKGEDEKQVALHNKEDIDKLLIQLEQDMPKAAEKPTLPVKTAPAVVKAMPTLPQEVKAKTVEFSALSAQSLFAGYSYSKGLTWMKAPCTEGKSDCWIARAVGGDFGYDPANLPAYLQRLKDVEQAGLLRRVTQSLQVGFIRILGHGGMIDTMTIKADTPQRRPVYLELSVEDVE